MGLQMEIVVDLDSVKVFLDEFKTKALVSAARKSINRSVSSLRTRANVVARENRKRMRAGEINKKFFRTVKAKGNSLDKMHASLSFSNKPVSLIRFVVGKKTARRQKGIEIADRKKLVVEVKPGRRVVLQSAFIAKGRGGRNHVFRRRTKKRTPIVKQSVPAFSVIFSRAKIRLPLEKFANKKLGDEFERTFKFELDKLIERRG